MPMCFMKSSLVPAALCSMVLLSACDSEPAGLLQQRIAELEGQADAARKRADLLQAKLDAKDKEQKQSTSAPPPSAKAEAREPDEAKALVGAAATLLGESLREKVKPGMLHTYQEAAWAGYRIEKSGVARGVAVPFFRDASGQWTCGWSDSQILAALDGDVPAIPAPPPAPTMPAASPAPAVSAPVYVPQPAPMERIPATAAVPTPVPTPMPAPEPASKSAPPRSGANKSFFVDPATGKLFRVRPDGTREPVPEMR